MTEIKTINIDGRLIIVRGIGRLFYEEGIPISLAVEYFNERDIEVSVLHVADECLKHGWAAKTVINKLTADFKDSLAKTDFQLLSDFCNADYPAQREMLYNYLFKGDDQKALELAKALIEKKHERRLNDDRNKKI